ncbi:MAG: hypothetical protein M3Y72_01600 [Acidobacteriota bacterium]|nr:hypothetical protein [Acidobacteriota bacterium]
MLKRVGVFALMLSAIGATILPEAAVAQDGYYGPRNYYADGDRGWDRHDRHEWKEQERREHRAEEWRERQWRDQARHQYEWRQRERWEDRHYRDYPPAASFYFGYNR